MNDSSPGTHDRLEKRHYNEEETGARLAFPVHDPCFEDSTRATLSHRSPFGSPSVAGLRDEPCVPNPGRSPCAGLPATPYRMAAVSEVPGSRDTRFGGHHAELEHRKWLWCPPNLKAARPKTKNKG
jgi:hypothetical protein